MKKKLFTIGMLLLAGVAFAFGQPQVTDSTSTVTYHFGDSFMEFLEQNWKALVAVILFFISEWIGETDKIPEGSLWRKIINWILAIAKKQVTKSPKMKRISNLYEKELKAKNKALDLSKGFKIITTALILSGLTFTASAQNKHPHRWYPFSKKTELVSGNQNLQADFPIFSKDSTIWFAPSASFDVFSKEMKTGEYAIGAIPGIGYGIKWNPFRWKEHYLLGLDIYAQAALRNTDVVLNSEGIETPIEARYFSVKVLPALSLLNWVHVGYGPLFNIGLKDTEGYITGVFLIGVSKEF
jgi:hypothetical protein